MPGAVVRDARHPRLQVLDVARAVQYLRSHAQRFKLDAPRPGLAGSSAGGCTALRLAFHDDLAKPFAGALAAASTRPAAVLALDAQTTLDPPEVIRWVGTYALRHEIGNFMSADLKIITGLGRHSTDGAPLLRPTSAI